MKIGSLFLVACAAATGLCSVVDRQLLSYAPTPNNTYVLPKKDGAAPTLLDFVKSRDDLSTLGRVLDQAAGFAAAFDTPTSWNFTFFAPSDKAFNNTGAYFSTFASTPKGKWWLGDLVQHHYVPNSNLKKADFNATATRIQTGTFLYIGTQVVGDTLMLNGVSAVTEADVAVANGIVHIIDHILDPSAQIYQPDVGKTPQKFIPGSCSNPALPYC